MKRVFFLLLVIVLWGGVVRAQDAHTRLLDYFPDKTDVAMSFRIDDAYINELDAIWGQLLDKVPPELNPPDVTLRQALDETLATANLSLNELRTWLGDQAAIAVLDATVPVPLGVIVVEITNRQAAETFVEDTLRESGDDYSRRLDTTDTIFLIESGSMDMVLVISDEVLILAAEADFTYMKTLEHSLLDVVAVQTALAGLPAESYNIIGYTDAGAMDTILGLPPAPGMDETLVFGLTILDETVLVMDITQITTAPPALPAVDSGFLRYVPMNAAGVLHGTDLTASFDLLAGQPGFSPRDLDQLDASLALLGIDLREDILSWTTGDYVLFGDADISALLQLFEVPFPSWETLPLDFGLVIEVTDSDRAQTLVNKLEVVLELLASGQPDVAVSRRMVMGVDALVLTITAPLGQDEVLTFDVLIGANDAIFFAATAPAAKIMLNSLIGINGSAAFHRTARYFLPDSTSMAYVDGDGLTFSTVVVLALLGPVVGDIFDDIMDEFQRGQQIQAQRVSYRAQSIGEIRLLFETQRDMFDGATITSAYGDKLLLTRFTLQVAD